MSVIKLYIVVDIGCIECGMVTEIILVTQNKKEATKLSTGEYFAGGQRSLEMFEKEIEVIHK